MKAKDISRAAMIAAMYACLTLILREFSFGPVQLRVTEALTVLPMLCPAAVPGLFMGCLIANIIGGSVIWDVAVGSLVTLASAILTRKWRARPVLALLPPVILNAVFVGAVVYRFFMTDAALSALPVTMLQIGAGQALACYGLGLPLYALLKKMPASLWH